MRKFGVSILLGLCFLLFGAMVVAASSTLPMIHVSPTSFTVKPDVATDFDIQLRNSSAGTIEAIQVNASGGAVDVEVIESPSDTAKITAGSFARLKLRIYADGTLANSSGHVIGLLIQYKDSSGTIKEVVSNINITVLDNTGSTPPPVSTPTPAQMPELRMTAPNSYVSAEAGRTSEVNVTLSNTSAFLASSVRVFPVANKDFKVSMAEDLGAFNLHGNNKKDFKLKITPAQNLPAGDYTVRIEFTYMNNVKNQFSGSGEIYVKISDSAVVEDAHVTLEDFVVNPGTVVAGNSFVLGANVKNLSSRQVTGMRVTLTGLDSAGISMSNATTSRSIGTMAANTGQAVSYTLTTNAKMKTGSYPVALELSWVNKDGVAMKESFPFYVSIRAKDASGDDGKRAVLEITSIARPTGLFGVGQDVVISATIKNLGENTAKNIKVAADPEANLVPRTANIQMINQLAPGESRTLSFTFAATAMADSRNHNIGFTVDYETGVEAADGGQMTDSFMQYVGVSISNPEKDKENDEDDESTNKSQPKIIVSNYVVDPLIVMAGKEFDLDLTYMNTHRIKSVHNIKVSASVIGTETEKGNVFTPVGSSNTFYIDEIAPKGETTQHLRMYTVPDAQPKNYILTVRFEYEDAEGNTLMATEEVGINVQQVTNLEIGDIYLPSEVGLNQSQYVYFTLQNRGAVNLRNLKIKMEGEGIDAQNSEIIYGNFAAGAYEQYDGSFFPIAEGQQEVRVVISYDNDMMEPVERVETYKINVVNYNMDGDMSGEWGGGWDDGYPVEEEETGFVAGVINFVKKPIFWGSAIGVVVLAGAGIAVWQVQKRRKKEMDFDE